MSKLILALDQGTTSSRSILFNRSAKIIARAQQEIPQIFPSPGHVEHDPETIWRSQVATAKSAMRRAKAGDVVAIGIANQRETVVLWHRETGQPMGNAIVWQSRITAPQCEKLKRQGVERLIRSRTGLLVDPYFSGTKISYLLDQYKLRGQARRGKILAGTIDTFLLWRLTGGRVHATDVSNASRTMLFNIRRQQWDDELLKLLRVPRAILPEVRDSSGEFGVTEKKWFGAEIPICGVVGDQQAATFGQCCFRAGMAKNTYGTGCFLMLNTGPKPVNSKRKLLTTIGWRVDGKTTYCLEGSVFVGGAAVGWLRDGLQIIRRADEVEKLARTVDDNGGTYFVPALVGLGAPHWDPYARGLIIGLDRSTKRGHIARAAVESMAFQSRDLIEAMERDTGAKLRQLRVDGGAASNNDLLQFQADLLGMRIQRSAVAETTALGAAYLAGLAVGMWPSLRKIAATRSVDQEFCPSTTPRWRKQKQDEWQRALERSRNWAQP